MSAWLQRWGALLIAYGVICDMVAQWVGNTTGWILALGMALAYWCGRVTGRAT